MHPERRFGQLLVLSRKHNIDRNKVMTSSQYSNVALATNDGQFMKTNKAILMHKLEQHGIQETLYVLLYNDKNLCTLNLYVNSSLPPINSIDLPHYMLKSDVFVNFFYKFYILRLLLKKAFV